jgi:hypothetical protein
MTVAEVEVIFRVVAASRPVIGMGISGLAPVERIVEPLTRLCAAVGF